MTSRRRFSTFWLRSTYQEEFPGRLHEASHFCRYPPLRALVSLLSGVATERRPEKVRHDGGDSRKGLGSDVWQPAPHMTLEFQGGEPLLNFELIRFIVPSCEGTRRQTRQRPGHCCRHESGRRHGRDASLFSRQDVYISTSLDGPAFIHNANRPRPGGNSYELAVQNIQRARDIVGAQTCRRVDDDNATLARLSD